MPNLSIAWIEKYVPYTAGPMAKFVILVERYGGFSPGHRVLCNFIARVWSVSTVR